MKILYINQHFITTAGVGGTRQHDICRYLAERGHEITLLSGYSASKGLPKPRRFSLWRVHHLDGFKVYVCNTPYSQEMSPQRRVFAFLQFAFIATLIGLKERKIDLVFATSTPLTVTIPGLLVSKLRRKPYAFEARDLWPEDLVIGGRMKESSFIHRFFSFLEQATYRHARKVTVVSEGFHQRLLERGMDADKLNMIPLGADGDKFKNATPNHRFFEERRLGDKKLAIYTGAHGKANGLDQLLDAAEFLRHRNDIAIVLFGKGSEKSRLEATAKDRGLTNLHFFAPVPIGELVTILAACDFGLIIFRQVQRPRPLTPNKFYDYCFSGIPSVVNFSGTTAEIVRREQIGLVSEPGCPEDLASTIEQLADRENERVEMGRRARALGWERYDRKRIASQMEDFFERALRSH